MTLAKTAFADAFPGAPLATAAADYDIVRRAIAHIRGHWRAQPEVDVIAKASGVSPTDLHHLFRRWCGLTPKAFLQALTLDSARELLRASRIALATRPADQLTIHPPALVTLRGHHVKAAQFRHPGPKSDVRAASRHVCGDGDAPLFACHGNNHRLIREARGIQDPRVNPAPG